MDILERMGELLFFHTSPHHLTSPPSLQKFYNSLLMSDLRRWQGQCPLAEIKVNPGLPQTGGVHDLRVRRRPLQTELDGERIGPASAVQEIL